MRLLIDVGNTRTKAWLVSENGNIVKHRVFQRDLSGLEKFASLKEISCGILSSVADFPARLLSGISKRFPLVDLSPDCHLPFKIKYHTPETIGSDRLAVAAGAIRIFGKKPSLILDAGTCLKFNLVAPEAVFLGGSISPGLNMRLRALHAYSARLPLIKEIIPVSFPGLSTRDSILSGTLGGILAEAESVISVSKKKYPGVKILITGGDGPFFAENLKFRTFAKPDLMATGLFHILEYNLPQSKS